MIKRLLLNVALVLSLLLPPMIVGCDDETVYHEKTVKEKSDGTTVTKEEKKTESSDGSKTTTEKKVEKTDN